MLTKPLWAVTASGTITNVSYTEYGRTVWIKAIFDSRNEAENRAAEMNEISHGQYTAEPITVKIKKGARV